MQSEVFFFGGGGEITWFSGGMKRGSELSPKNSKGRLWKIDCQLSANEESV